MYNFYKCLRQYRQVGKTSDKSYVGVMNTLSQLQCEEALVKLLAVVRLT